MDAMSLVYFPFAETIYRIFVNRHIKEYQKFI